MGEAVELLLGQYAIISALIEVKKSGRNICPCVAYLQLLKGNNLFYQIKLFGDY